MSDPPKEEPPPYTETPAETTGCGNQPPYNQPHPNGQQPYIQQPQPPEYSQTPPSTHTQQYGQPPAPPPQYVQVSGAYGQPSYNQQNTYHMQYPPNVIPGLTAQQASSATVIIRQPGTTFGPSSCHMDCPHCNASMTTSTARVCGGVLWMVAGIICLMGLFFPCIWFGCCLIPFCIPSLYDVKHSCPSCQAHIATYRQGGFGNNSTTYN